MKKNILLILTLIICATFGSQAYCSENSAEFIQKLSTCSDYVDNSENKIFVILGWSTRRCYYQEISHKEIVSCSFKQLELEDLIKSMKNEKYNHTKGIQTLNGAQKYINSSSNCVIESKY